MHAATQSAPYNAFAQQVAAELAIATAANDEDFEVVQIAERFKRPRLVEKVLPEPPTFRAEVDATAAGAGRLIWLGIRLFWMCLYSVARMGVQDIRDAIARRALRITSLLAVSGWATAGALLAIHFIGR